MGAGVVTAAESRGSPAAYQALAMFFATLRREHISNGSVF
jgi:hypothetical protein